MRLCVWRQSSAGERIEERRGEERRSRARYRFYVSPRSALTIPASTPAAMPAPAPLSLSLSVFHAAFAPTFFAAAPPSLSFPLPFAIAGCTPATPSPAHMSVSLVGTSSLAEISKTIGLETRTKTTCCHTAAEVSHLALALALALSIDPSGAPLSGPWNGVYPVACLCHGPCRGPCRAPSQALDLALALALAFALALALPLALAQSQFSAPAPPTPCSSA